MTPYEYFYKLIADYKKLPASAVLLTDYEMYISNGLRKRYSYVMLPRGKFNWASLHKSIQHRCFVFNNALYFASEQDRTVYHLTHHV